jgi:hypothetical protein
LPIVPAPSTATVLIDSIDTPQPSATLRREAATLKTMPPTIPRDADNPSRNGIIAEAIRTETKTRSPKKGPNRKNDRKH